MRGIGDPGCRDGALSSSRALPQEVRRPYPNSSRNLRAHSPTPRNASAVFEDIRQAFRDLLSGNLPPEERRAALHDMKDSLVHARLAVDDLREAVAKTRRRLDSERSELETIRRRKSLAQGIGDQETVKIAERFETQHAQKLALISRKLEAEEGELALLEREVEEMTTQLKAASAGVGSGLHAEGPASASSAPGAAGADADRQGLEREFDTIARAQRRSANEADADARLAELKRRMGK
jgi:hypothetical protein